MDVSLRSCERDENETTARYRRSSGGPARRRPTSAAGSNKVMSHGWVGWLYQGRASRKEVKFGLLRFCCVVLGVSRGAEALGLAVVGARCSRRVGAASSNDARQSPPVKCCSGYTNNNVCVTSSLRLLNFYIADFHSNFTLQERHTQSDQSGNGRLFRKRHHCGVPTKQQISKIKSSRTKPRLNQFHQTRWRAGGLGGGAAPGAAAESAPAHVCAGTRRRSQSLDGSFLCSISTYSNRRANRHGRFPQH